MAIKIGVVFRLVVINMLLYLSIPNVTAKTLRHRDYKNNFF